MPTKIKWKVRACFILYFNFEKGLLWQVIRYSYQFIYFILFYISFNISRYQFSRFFRLHSTLSEKIFCCKYSFLNRFTQLHTFDPLNDQNLLSGTNFFLSIFSKMPSETFFFKNLLTKFCKSIFYVSAKNCHSRCIFK